jgi:hypothetical protein
LPLFVHNNFFGVAYAHLERGEYLRYMS